MRTRLDAAARHRARAAAAAACALLAAATHALPSCVGQPGAWHNDDGAAPFNLTWRYAAPCSLPIATAADLHARLVNHTVYFIGDSTMRGMMNDVALWAHGCPPRSLTRRRRRRRRRRLQPAAEVMRCSVVAEKTWAHWLATLPFPGGAGFLNVGFRSLTFVRDVLRSDWWQPLVVDGRDPPSDGGRPYAPGSLTVVMSAGHWNLRFDGQADQGNFSNADAILANYLAEVAALIANASRASGGAARARLLWRTTLPVDGGNPRFEQGAFNAATVAAANGRVAGAWRDAGFQVLDLWKFASVADAARANWLRSDGIHYRPFANTAMASEILSAIWERRAAAVGAAGSVAGPAATPPPLSSTAPSATVSATASMSAAVPPSGAASPSGAVSVSPSGAESPVGAASGSPSGAASPSGAVGTAAPLLVSGMVSQARPSMLDSARQPPPLAASGEQPAAHRRSGQSFALLGTGFPPESRPTQWGRWGVWGGALVASAAGVAAAVVARRALTYSPR